MKALALALASAALLLIGVAAAADEAQPIDGNPLVPVAGGSFVFGSDGGEENERPQRTLALPAFWMNRTEISNAQYRRFVAATGHRPAFYADHPQLGLDDHPVVGVSWSDANDFCAYYGLTLPSEQQFERAARGATGARFPWGDAPADYSRVNRGAEACCAGDDGDGYAMTAPVDSFAAGQSAEGILDLIGNVWEWTSGWYAPYEGDADPVIAGKYRVLRGGSWNSDGAHLSATYRLAYDPDFRFSGNGGFRCVRSGG
jgi:iron(II)-dependent oxidoreductase